MSVGEVVKVVEHFAMEREREIGELREQVATLTKEKENLAGELNSMADMQYAEGNAAKARTRELEARVATLTRERDDANELLRIAITPIAMAISQPAPAEDASCSECGGKGFVGVPENDSEDHGRITGWHIEPCDECTPELAGELVPWNSETRPRGVVLIRESGGQSYEFMADWRPYGVEFGRTGCAFWDVLFNKWEWSRDGITWQRCGTVREGGAT